MLVEIKKPERVHELEATTGIPAQDLVNQILDIHLDEKKKSAYLSRELQKAFEIYKKSRSQQTA